MPRVWSDRTCRRLADVIVVLCFAVVLATAALAVGASLATGKDVTGGGSLAEGLFFLLDAPVFAVVGALIVHSQVRNPVGWLLITVGVMWALGLSMSVYAEYGIRGNPGSVPAPALVNALGIWTWIPAVGLMAIFVPLLFPDGHLPSARWRWLPWLAGVVMLVLSIASVLSPSAFDDSSLEGVTNPLAAPLPGWLVQGLIVVFFPLFPICMLAAAVAAVIRYRRSEGVERLQLKWLVTAGVCFALFFGIMLIVAGLFPATQNNRVVNTLLPLTFTLFPLAIGAAILRYRLYDIDVVINRSLVFGALASFITAVYVTVVVGIGHLIGSGDRPNLALSVAATAIIAVAFEPVRNRLQRLANRLVYGERATPYEVLSSFADRVGGAYDATRLLPLMARTVGQGVDATAAQVWLRRADGFELAATWSAGDADDTATGPAALGSALDAIPGDRVLEVRDHDELLGAVTVTKPPGKDLSPVEERLLATLAAQAGPVLRNMRLIEDLRTSRQRVVARQDEERRRLERNLHDGAQQSLVAVALMIRLAQPGVALRNAGAGECLERAASELGAAIEELRDLARGIFPVILADRGLGAALVSLAERSPVPVVVEDDTTQRVSSDVERALYFIAAEALVTSPPAGAHEATVGLRHLDGTLTMRVDDDGMAADAPTRALPLQGLLDRAAVVGAELHIEDAPTGLHLSCTVAAPGPTSSRDTDHADVTAVPLGAGL